MKPYIILLCRKSTNDKRNQQNSLAYQERIVKEAFPQFIPDKIINLSETGTDIAGERLLFKKEFLDVVETKAKAGYSVICLAHAIDRYTRNFTDFAKIYKLHISYDIKFYSCNGNLTTREEALLFSIQVGLADQFIFNLKNKQKAGMEQCVQEGRYIFGSVQGYNSTNKAGIKVLDPIKSKGIKIIFEEFSKGEYSLGSYSKRANEIAKEYGVKIRGKSTLHGILKNPFYCGLIKYKDELYKGVHEALISQALFNRVQEILTGKCRKY